MINAKDIKYLSLEGGGGKGIVYIGAVKGLEQKIRGKIGLPLFPLLTGINQRQLVGISGSSAGAITAFMLALGMDSQEIEKEVNRVLYMPMGIRGTSLPVSPFEKFFEDANDSANRVVKLYEKEKEYPNFKFMRQAFEVLLFTPKILENILNQVRIGLTTNVLLRRIFFTSDGIKLNSSSSIYLNSLFFNRGLFSGLAVRDYFNNLMAGFIARYKALQFLPPIDGYKKPGDVTFYDFFSMSGVDLVVSASNVSLHKPKYFSVYHTPHFPVTEAIALSMNFPFLFKPVFVDFKVHNLQTDKYNEDYRGLYVDGGMLNNLPIHAFDEPSPAQIFYRGTQTPFLVASNLPSYSRKFNKSVLGLRLEERDPLPRKEKDEFEPNHFLISAKYVSDLFYTFLYAGEEGQIRSEEERNNTISLSTDGISITDFASPTVNFARNEPNQGRLKIALINSAAKNVTTNLS